MDGVDDADDGGFGGDVVGEEGEAGFAAATPVDGFAGTGADRVHGDERFACVAAVTVNRLDEEQAMAFERGVFHGADDVADDAA